ncbi:MAG: hypothetical protein M5R38_18350 [Candidatus Methylomirabilis sp.]|nr:hypothetical protein [Candidatus Methylomirabilis sp.]
MSHHRSLQQFDRQRRDVFHLIGRRVGRWAAGDQVAFDRDRDLRPRVGRSRLPESRDAGRAFDHLDGHALARLRLEEHGRSKLDVDLVDQQRDLGHALRRLDQDAAVGRLGTQRVLRPTLERERLHRPVILRAIAHRVERVHGIVAGEQVAEDPAGDPGARLANADPRAVIQAPGRGHRLTRGDLANDERAQRGGAGEC